MNYSLTIILTFTEVNVVRSEVIAGLVVSMIVVIINELRDSGIKFFGAEVEM